MARRRTRGGSTRRKLLVRSSRSRGNSDMCSGDAKGRSHRGKHIEIEGRKGPTKSESGRRAKHRVLPCAGRGGAEQGGGSSTPFGAAGGGDPGLAPACDGTGRLLAAASRARGARVDDGGRRRRPEADSSGTHAGAGGGPASAGAGRGGRWAADGSAPVCGGSSAGTRRRWGRSSRPSRAGRERRRRRGEAEVVEVAQAVDVG